ncbi:MAG TPA: PssE/Cps14G family polysaccharide biosynthesis glycosyltransferase [archaeon]|nr:PssE/Cps14G family polysaccharide biosynthesis glycosyltransferase [archaeon]
MKTKIFVTTGSVLEFDILTKEIDKINENKRYAIICQIGIGKYIPKNAEHFRFKKNLDKDYSWADIVITHTGAGTLFELLHKNKKIICISNPKATDNHELAEQLNKERHLIFLKGEDIKQLNKTLQKIQNLKQEKYKPIKSTIGKEILNYINR